MDKYSLLVGKVRDIKVDRKNIPHLELLIESNRKKYRASINLESKNFPKWVLYKKIEDFNDPELIKKLSKLGHGLVEVEGNREDLGLDYTTELVDINEMKEVPFQKKGPNNDLVEYLMSVFNNTINNPFVTVYIWGEHYGPHNEKDMYFNFYPAEGIHNIHRNKYFDSCDGAVLVRELDKWTALFFAFQ